MSCAERHLSCALVHVASPSLPSARFEVLRRRAWASALFVGERFTVAVRVADDDEAFEQWLADLPDADVRLSGHFVASAEVIERSAGVAVIELLVIEEN